MSEFSGIFNPNSIDNQVKDSLSTSNRTIERCLKKTHHTPEDLPTLLSPAASEYLETLAQKSQALTIQRHGRIMQLFAPLYISNECYNTCTYCGFSIENKYPRLTLTPSQIHTECQHLKKRGFDHILLLTGEAPGKVDANLIANAVSIAHQYFSSVGIEVQPLKKEEYIACILNGADSLTLYQETYHPAAYARYHLKGKKKNYNHRLNSTDIGGQAGFYKINIGALLGLYDWRFEALSVSTHLQHLQNTYWKTKYAISFPRIQNATGNFKPHSTISNAEYVQLICAIRLCFPDTGITLSTRETPSFRDGMIKLGITTLSAESNTAPGGYSNLESTEQFEIADHRSLEKIQNLLKDNLYEPVMKDWSKAYIGL